MKITELRRKLKLIDKEITVSPGAYDDSYVIRTKYNYSLVMNFILDNKLQVLDRDVEGPRYNFTHVIRISILTWAKLAPAPMCDLCQRKAVWKHPQGGLRCNKCPRPE